MEIKCYNIECASFSIEDDNACGIYTDINLCDESFSFKGNKEPVAEVPCSVGLKGRLIKASASLLKKRMSDLDEDYPIRFSKRTLREIQKHNDHLGDVARELRAIADAL